MRAGGQTGAANVADDLSLTDSAAGAQALGIRGHVGVQRAVLAAVLDDDGAAIAAFPAVVDDLAVTGGPDRGAGGCCIIDASVRAPDAEFGMQPVRVEAGADAAEIHRRAQEGLAHALAVGRIEFAIALIVDKADGAEGAAAVDELGGDDAAVADLLAV